MTDLEKLHQERASEDRYRSLFEVTTDAILVADTVSNYNYQIQKLSGYMLFFILILINHRPVTF